MDRTSKIFFCIVLCLVMSAGLAWLVSTKFISAPLITMFILCTLGSAVATALLAILDATRAALLASVLVAAGLVIIPVLKKLELPKAIPYTLSASFFTGFFCSRLMYKES